MKKKEEIINKTIEIFSKYLGDINSFMFREWLNHDIIEEPNSKTRYLLFYDFDEEHHPEPLPVHLYPDGSLVEHWVDFYHNDGSILDEDVKLAEEEDEPSPYETAYVAVIDLKKERYFKMNGNQEEFDYHTPGPHDDTWMYPEWSKWLLKQ